MEPDLPLNDQHFIRASEIDQPSVLAVWSSILPPSCRLLGASLFGDLFLARESGEVLMLDLVSGDLKQIAVCVEKFEWDLTQRERREEWLMQSLADAAIAAGLKPSASECLAFRTPPMLGGALNPDNLAKWDFVAYHDGTAKLLSQITELPVGTQVVIRPDA